MTLLYHGFRFFGLITRTGWANNTGFPPKAPVTPGFDPIIGQAGSNITSRSLVGTDPNNQSASLSLATEWVVPKGGEYFFSPSIPALKSTFALSAGSSA